MYRPTGNRFFGHKPLSLLPLSAILSYLGASLIDQNLRIR